jgi:hypothetical protein
VTNVSVGQGKNKIVGLRVYNKRIKNDGRERRGSGADEVVRSHRKVTLSKRECNGAVLMNAEARRRNEERPEVHLIEIVV